MHDKTNLELQMICEANGLSNRGGKLDLIARLVEAGITEVKKPEERRETRKGKRGRPKKQ